MSRISVSFYSETAACVLEPATIENFEVDRLPKWAAQSTLNPMRAHPSHKLEPLRRGTALAHLRQG